MTFHTSRLIIVATGILLSLTVGAGAKKEKVKSALCTPRIPVIEFEKALAIATRAVSRIQAAESVFIDKAVLICKDNRHYWVVGFRRRAYESGHLLIHVYMDGSTRLISVKDG